MFDLFLSFFILGVLHCLLLCCTAAFLWVAIIVFFVFLGFHSAGASLTFLVLDLRNVKITK